ncbi:MAG TPA: glycine cleavage system aminomethyltransferase GcvT [Candidatus Acidoferrales bacterium]|nr:glycine cleavage system aminomethyltransferase GcvT [Candidatus Acidoferrales bacterium]
MATVNLRRTPLYDAHAALQARMVGFGGFEMPVQYAGVLREHDAVRHRAGLFDLSHMGQFVLRGTEIGEWADRLTVNDVANMRPWQARYNLFCSETGGTHDDVIFYRQDEDEWLLVVNASNARKMWGILQAHRRNGITLENHHGTHALIAIQGPRSVEIVERLVAPADRETVVAMRYYFCARTVVAGIPVLMARTGYTGEDGFELFAPNDDALALWDALLEAGVSHGLEPCGLGARDVLRLEAGMPLYGHELEEDITPLQAGLSWAIKFGKPAFEGKIALEAQRVADDYTRIVGFTLEGRAPQPRMGYRVFVNDLDVGEVRSGAVGIGTALVDPSVAKLGSHLEIEIRDRRWPATVVKLPFYKRPK